MPTVQKRKYPAPKNAECSFYGFLAIAKVPNGESAGLPLAKAASNFP